MICGLCHLFIRNFSTLYVFFTILFVVIEAQWIIQFYMSTYVSRKNKKKLFYFLLFLCFVTNFLFTNFFSLKNYYFGCRKRTFEIYSRQLRKKYNFHNFLSELVNSHSKIIVIVLMMWRDFFWIIVNNYLVSIARKNCLFILGPSMHIHVTSHYFFFRDLSQIIFREYFDTLMSFTYCCRNCRLLLSQNYTHNYDKPE